MHTPLGPLHRECPNVNSSRPTLERLRHAPKSQPRAQPGSFTIGVEKQAPKHDIKVDLYYLDELVHNFVDLGEPQNPFNGEGRSYCISGGECYM